MDKVYETVFNLAKHNADVSLDEILENVNKAFDDARTKQFPTYQPTAGLNGSLQQAETYVDEHERVKREDWQDEDTSKGFVDVN